MEQLEVKAKMENYKMCVAFIEEQLDKADFDNKTKMKIITASEEIIVNVMTYAYSGGEGDLVIVFDDGVDSIRITFSDNGKPFNPFDEPEKDISLSAEERNIGGMGILMIKNLMDDVRYEYKDNQNVLTIMKKLIGQ